MLQVVVIFRCNIGYQIFYSNTGICFTLSFQFLQPLVVGGDVETVKDSPIQIETYIHGLVEYTILFEVFSGGTHFTVSVINSSFITC